MSTRPVQTWELTGPLLRAARMLARLKADELADESGLGIATIKRAEAASGIHPLNPENAQRLIDTYARLGVDIVVYGQRPGVLVSPRADRT